MVKTVKETCTNISSLYIRISSGVFLDSIIPTICELSSLKILKICLENYRNYEEVSEPLVKILGDNLKFVECLSFDFHIKLSYFEYFTDNCIANLKKWN